MDWISQIQTNHFSSDFPATVFHHEWNGTSYPTETKIQKHKGNSRNPSIGIRPTDGQVHLSRLLESPSTTAFNRDFSDRSSPSSAQSIVTPINDNAIKFTDNDMPFEPSLWTHLYDDSHGYEWGQTTTSLDQIQRKELDNFGASFQALSECMSVGETDYRHVRSTTYDEAYSGKASASRSCLSIQTESNFGMQNVPGHTISTAGVLGMQTEDFDCKPFPWPSEPHSVHAISTHPETFQQLPYSCSPSYRYAQGMMAVQSLGSAEKEDMYYQLSSFSQPSHQPRTQETSYVDPNYTPKRAKTSSNVRSRRRIQRNPDMDQQLVQWRRQGLSYREIKERGGYTEAESTLRGRHRALIKPRMHRLRKPVWTVNAVEALKDAVAIYARPQRLQASDVRDDMLSKIPWKKVAEWMETERNCYRYGNATVKKKYQDLLQHSRHLDASSTQNY